MIVCGQNMVHSQNHIRLLMKIQKIHYKITLNKNEIQNFITRNWIYILVTITFNGMMSIAFYVSAKHVDYVIYPLDIDAIGFMHIL